MKNIKPQLPTLLLIRDLIWFSSDMKKHKMDYMWKDSEEHSFLTNCFNKLPTLNYCTLKIDRTLSDHNALCWLNICSCNLAVIDALLNCIQTSTWIYLIFSVSSYNVMQFIMYYTCTLSELSSDFRSYSADIDATKLVWSWSLCSATNWIN